MRLIKPVGRFQHCAEPAKQCTPLCEAKKNPFLFMKTDGMIHTEEEKDAEGETRRRRRWREQRIIDVEMK